jgi:hypothetical protein
MGNPPIHILTYQLEDDEQKVVDDEGPFAAISVGGDSEDDGTDGAQHEH